MHLPFHRFALRISWRRRERKGEGEDLGALSIPSSFAPRPATVDSPLWLHLLLFLLTLLSVTVAGAMQQGAFAPAGWTALVHLVDGIPFAVTLLSILTVHEFAHYIAARRWGVRASLPYFLPLPFISFLGTLGAVIRIRSPIPHRKALLDIGAAGPLAGFVVSVIACTVGLRHARIVDGASFCAAPPIQLGSSLLFHWLSQLFLPAPGPGQVVLLGPVAFAGWVGLFITAFNLFPVGQLDGGHVVYALFGGFHRYIARSFFAFLLGMGIHGILSLVFGWTHGWPGWLALALLLMLLGRDHPAPSYPWIALDRPRRLTGYISLVVFIVCFTPTPFRLPPS